jgi:hypothetical protein
LTSSSRTGRQAETSVHQARSSATPAASTRRQQAAPSQVPLEPMHAWQGVRSENTKGRSSDGRQGPRSNDAQGPMLGDEGPWQDHAESGRRGQGGRRHGAQSRGGRGRPASEGGDWGYVNSRPGAVEGYRPVLPAVARIDLETSKKVTRCVDDCKQVGQV